MSGTSVVSFSEYVSPVRRRFRIVLIGAVIGAVLGFLLFQLQSEEYSAVSKVQITPIVSQVNEPNVDVSRQVNTVNEESIASSEAVSRQAAAIIQLAADKGVSDYSVELIEEASAIVPADASIAEVSDALSVSLVPDSQVLLFTATSSEKAKSKRISEAAALAYLDIRESEAIAARVDARERLDAREEALVSELAEIYESSAVPAVDGEGNEVIEPAKYLTVSKEQELTAIGQIKASLESGSVTAGTLLSRGRSPSGVSSLPIFAGPFFGALLGATLAIALAFVLDRQDDRLRSASTELSALDVLLLGSAPASKKSKKGISLFANNTSGGDAYRRIQGTLLFNLDKENRSVVLVAGIKSSDASRCVAANIAASAARAGRRTLLIGADLRNNKLHEGLGLSDVVSGQASLAKVIENLEYIDPNLDILGAGSETDSPTSILQGESFGRLLSAVQADYDLVLIEAPGILDVADAMDIARLSDGTLVVVDGESESRQAVADSINQVRNVGSEVVGVVVAENPRG